LDKKLSNADSWREVHEEDKAALRRDFKISVLAELEAGKPLAQIAREYGIHPSLPCRWKAELAENPEKAFKVTETSTKIRRRLQNWKDFLPGLCRN